MATQNSTLPTPPETPARPLNPILYALGGVVFLAVLITLIVVIFR